MEEVLVDNSDHQLFDYYSYCGPSGRYFCVRRVVVIVVRVALAPTWAIFYVETTTNELAVMGERIPLYLTGTL